MASHKGNAALAKDTAATKKEIDWEWGGPIGALCLTVFLPVIVVGLWAFCSKDSCSVYPPGFDSLDALWAFVSSGALTVTSTSAQVVAGWLAFQVVLHLILPGKEGFGLPQPDGSRDSYRLNGLLTYAVVTASVFANVYFDWLPLVQLYDIFPQLLATAMLLVAILSIYVYAVSFVPGARIAEHGNSGNVFYDFWMGRHFIPFIGPIDVKFFCEQRPGLMAWCLFNFAFALKQYELHGTITNSMVLVNVFHYIYVMDTFVFEPAVLSTMDITTEGFGFMLCFGDLVWVPFTYSLQARYLVDYPVHLSTAFAVFVTVVYVAGLVIFRLSNLQKDQFRSNPDGASVAHLKYIKTERGSKLLITGWWGVARHINYLGDWLLFFASCLATGFSHIIPYFYAVYFAALLIHRESRDDHNCSKKYGKDWEKYRKIVPSRIIPYVY